MTMSFKFNFSSSLEGSVAGGDGSANPSSDARSKSATDANELIAKLIERSRRNSSVCTLVNASSTILSTDDGMSTDVKSSEDEFKPNLRFQSHESIDLHSGNIDGLRFVIPKYMVADNTNDLIPGVYEGGLKVWECSVDLCRFLASSMDEPSSAMEDGDLDALHAAVERALGPGGTTMELGCGHGLPGCLILRESIRRISKKIKPEDGGVAISDDISAVIFSDFNDFVLHHATIPNAQLNVCGLRKEDGVAMDECRTAQALVERSIFAGGDWMGLSDKLSGGNLSLPGCLHGDQGEDNRLDLILAAETTYTPESCEDTAFLMLRHLKVDVGVGLVATKRFYFGVGGGTDLFIIAAKKLLTSDEGPYSGLRLCVRTVQSFDTGNANIRDILEVRCQRKEG